MKGGNILNDLGRGVQYIFDPGKLIVGLTKPKQGRGRPKGTKNKKLLTLINEFNNNIII